MIRNILIIFFLLSSLVHSQTLKEEVQALLTQSKQVHLSNLDSSYFYLKKGLPKAHQLQNDTLLARYYFNIGDIYYKQDSLTKARFEIKKALNYSKKGDFKKGISVCYERLGLIEKKSNNFSLALDFYQKALEIAEKYQYHKRQIYLTQCMADLFSLKQDSLQAQYYYNKALSNALRINDSIQTINSYNRIGDFFRTYQNVDSALYYYNRGILFASKINDLEGLSMIYLNIASLLLEAKDLEKAHYYLEKVNPLIHSSKENDRYFVYNGLSSIYYHLKGDYPNALKHFRIAEDYMNSKGISDPTRSIFYNDAHKLFFDMNDYKNAYIYFSKHKDLNDSLFQIDKEREFAQVRTEYEVEKKDQQIGLLTKEKELEASKRKQFIYGSIALVIPLVLLLLFYRNRIKTQKLLNEKEVQRLEKEKALEQAESLLKGQDQERNRLAKEIHDGVGAQLAGLKLNIEDLHHETQHSELENIAQKLENTFFELRSISHNLSVQYIQEHSLKELLTALKTQYEKKKLFDIEITLFPPDVLDTLNSFQKHHLYRIIQELFYNTQKHAHATEVSFTVTLRDHSLYMIYEDNGKGFDKLLLQKGIGLLNIKERIQALKGKWEIDSHPKSGTTVLLTLPQNL